VLLTFLSLFHLFLICRKKESTSMIAGPVAVIPLPVAVACGRHPSGMWPWPVAVDKMGGPVAVVRNVGGAGKTLRLKTTENVLLLMLMRMHQHQHH
jgi:hypothetical protein